MISSIVRENAVIETYGISIGIAQAYNNAAEEGATAEEARDIQWRAERGISEDVPVVKDTVAPGAVDSGEEDEGYSVGAHDHKSITAAAAAEKQNARAPPKKVKPLTIREANRRTRERARQLPADAAAAEERRRLAEAASIESHTQSVLTGVDNVPDRQKPFEIPRAFPPPPPRSVLSL